MSFTNAEITLQDMVTSFQVDWRTVNQRLRSHPQEARILLEDEHITSSVLHLALQRRRSNYPPLQTVRRMLAIFPEAAWLGTHNYASPLHLLCRCNPASDYLALVRSTRPSVAQDSKALLYLWEYHVHAFGSEQDLMSFLTEGSREAARIYVELANLVEYTIKCPLRPFHSCLHSVAALTSDLELLQMALDVFRDQVFVCDEQGRFPLHSFLATKAGERPLDSTLPAPFRFPFDLLPLLRALVSAYPKAVTSRDSQGQLPLHVAIQAGWDEFDALLSDHPDSLDAADGPSGWLPFQLAAVSPASSLDTVYKLLRRKPCTLQASERCYVTKQVAHMPKEVNQVKINQQQSTQPRVSDDQMRLVYKVGASESSCLWKSLQIILTKTVAPEHQPGILHHLAGLAHCPRSLLQTMTNFHYTDLRSHDSFGRLPLHWLATAGRQEQKDYVEQGDVDESCPYLARLEYLLEVDPVACWLLDHAGQLPVHVAAGSMPVEGLRRFI